MIFMLSRSYGKLDGRGVGMCGVLKEVGLWVRLVGVGEVQRGFLRDGIDEVRSRRIYFDCTLSP